MHSSRVHVVDWQWSGGGRKRTLPADREHEPSCSLPHGHHDIGLLQCLLARPVNLKVKYSHVYTTWFSLSAPIYPGSPLLGS